MKAALKRIINIDIRRVKEAKLYEQGIFIEFDEEDMFKAKAMIIGPKDTIYDNAYLFFSIDFPKKYPYEPPIITYKSQNRIRIHPNIYVNGKVCLSILGTWSGPSWTSAMDIINVFITIQSLLDNNPLCNEPGYEKILPSKMHIHNDYNIVIEYNKIIAPNTKYILDSMGFLNNDTNKCGNIIFEFEIVFPTSIDEQRKQLLRKLLPKRKHQNKANLNTYTIKQTHIEIKPPNINNEYEDLDSEKFQQCAQQ